MQSSSTFIRLLKPIPEVKKNLHWSMILEKSEQGEALVNSFGFFQIQLGGGGPKGVAIEDKFCSFTLMSAW